jgi:hypothetical protein
LVTRVTSTAEDWQQQANQIFDAILPKCEIILTQGCSMHIHVSPTDSQEPQKRYKVSQLQSILKGVSYFDRAITEVLPSERKMNPWAESLVQGPFAPNQIKEAVGRDLKAG